MIALAIERAGLASFGGGAYQLLPDLDRWQATWSRWLPYLESASGPFVSAAPKAGAVGLLHGQAAVQMIQNHLLPVGRQIRPRDA
ncbi:MAG: hypothetical protein HY320_02810 [Armatimonadetes bacterium]|nr:hypothetical protein [Armatimonadota bacterium]